MAEGLLLIDAEACSSRLAHAVSPRLGSKGRFRSARHDFIGLVLRWIRQRRPSHAAVLSEGRLDERMLELLRVAGVVAWARPGRRIDALARALIEEAVGQGISVTLVSTRSRFLQWVREGVTLVNPARDNLSFHPAHVQALFGVAPNQIPDFLALAGDSSEGIPGVRGVGPRTAAKLLKQFGSVAGLLEALEKLPPSVRERLQRSAEQIRTGLKRAQVQRLPPGPGGLGLSLEDCRLRSPDPAEMTGRFQEAGMADLIPDRLPHRHLRPVRYTAVLTPQDLDALVAALRAAPAFSLDTETSGLHFDRSDLVGLSFSVRPDEAFYLPLGHCYPGVPEQRPLSQVVERLGPILSDPGKLKIGQNLKFDLLILGRVGLPVAGPIFDTMVASYLIHPDRRSHSLEALALEFLGFRMISYPELIQAQAGARSIAEVEISRAREYACEDADATFQLYRILEPALARQPRMEQLFYRIEMPLLTALERMERRGLWIDRAHLEQGAREAQARTQALAEEVYALAGERFDLHSPKAIRRVIQERLGLTFARKTRTQLGSLSRSSLMRLVDQHPAIARLLAYQAWAQWGLERFSWLSERLDPTTGRLHLGVHQAGTGTGRLRLSRFFRCEEEPAIERLLRSVVRVPEGSVLLEARYRGLGARLLAHWVRPPALLRQIQEDLPLPDWKALLSVPEIGRFVQRLLLRAKREGEVSTLFHRRRKLPQLNSPLPVVRQAAEREAVETVVEGSLGDLMKLSIVRVCHVLQEGKFQAGLIHMTAPEGLLLEVPCGELKRLARLLCETMERVAPLGVPVRVDLSVGESWGALTPYPHPCRPMPVVPG